MKNIKNTKRVSKNDIDQREESTGGEEETGSEDNYGNDKGSKARIEKPINALTRKRIKKMESFQEN